MLSIYWVAQAEEGLDALNRMARLQDLLGVKIVILDLHVTLLPA